MVFAGRISWNCGYENITIIRILKTVFTIFSGIFNLSLRKNKNIWRRLLKYLKNLKIIYLRKL